MTATSPPRRPQNGFRDLIVWQRAYQLVLECDRLSDSLRRRGRFVLSDQLFRAALSVVTNIAEGQGRLSKADNVRHLAMARGSVREVDALLAVVGGLGLVAPTDLAAATGYADEVGRMLTTLMRRLGGRVLHPIAEPPP